jgi:hypothetical protein
MGALYQHPARCNFLFRPLPRYLIAMPEQSYYARHREEILARQKKTYRRDREKRLAYSRQYDAAHRKEKRAYWAAYSADPAAKEKRRKNSLRTKESRNASTKKWCAANPERRREQRRRSARKRRAIVTGT